MEKPVRQYAGQLDAQLLVKWVATVSSFRGCPNPERSRHETVTTQRAECTETVGGRLLMSMEFGRRQWTAGVHDGHRATPAPAHTVDRRMGSFGGGDRGRKDAVSTPRPTRR